MKTKPLTRSLYSLLVTLVVTSALVGCEAMNDNPTSADKMQSIRQKESQDRANFNPSTTPPPTSTTGK